MAVYVDDAHIPATVPNGRASHTSTWCHLFADSQEELHEFAQEIGLRRAWFQPGRPRGDGSPSPYWHYDVTAGKRWQAIRHGAQEVTSREAVEIIRQRDAALSEHRESPRPANLADELNQRLAAAGIKPDDPGIQRWHDWNRMVKEREAGQ